MAESNIDKIRKGTFTLYPEHGGLYQLWHSLFSDDPEFEAAVQAKKMGDPTILLRQQYEPALRALGYNDDQITEYLTNLVQKRSQEAATSKLPKDLQGLLPGAGATQTPNVQPLTQDVLAVQQALGQALAPTRQSMLNLIPQITAQEQSMAKNLPQQFRGLMNAYLPVSSSLEQQLYNAYNTAAPNNLLANIATKGLAAANTNSLQQLLGSMTGQTATTTTPLPKPA